VCLCKHIHIRHYSKVCGQSQPRVPQALGLLVRGVQGVRTPTTAVVMVRRLVGEVMTIGMTGVVGGAKVAPKKGRLMRIGMTGAPLGVCVYVCEREGIRKHDRERTRG